jgi:hypothetical protein
MCSLCPSVSLCWKVFVSLFVVYRFSPTIAAMRQGRFARLAYLTCLAVVFFAETAFAQQTAEPQQAQLPEKPQPQRTSDAQVPAPATPTPPAHRFWDKRNAWLFAGVAASRALDFHSTGNMRRRGRNEILLTNEVVDNKPAFAAIEAAGALASVGISYLFHRTNHHRLERWTSYVHIGVTTAGAIRNYSLSSYRAPAP